MKNKIYRKATAAAAALLVMAMLSAMLPVPAFAGTNIPVTVDIQVTYIVKGNARAAGGDSFTLTADDTDTPMPDGTFGGQKTITIDEEGSYSFGDIFYEKPGVCWYTISREVTEKKGVVKDNSVYRAKVIALNDGHGYALVYRKGSDEKQELIYKDRTAPETGEVGAMLIYAGLALSAALALALLAALKMKGRQKGAEK